MVKDVVHAVLAAIPSIQAEGDRLDRDFGIDPTRAVNLADRSELERAFEQNACEQELQKVLFGFDEESLLKAAALLYYGRDRECREFGEMLHYLRSRRYSKVQSIRTIMEKISACRGYFEEGQRKLHAEGLSIDAI